MAAGDRLWPMQHADSEDPLRYAERDPIGVEQPAADLRGFNELAGWTERVTAAAGWQHHLSSAIHNTLLIPRAVLHLEYRDRIPAEYVVREDSYLLGKRGSNVAKVTITATGEFSVEMQDALPSAAYRLAGGGILPSTKYRYVALRLHAILNASQCTVRRYEGVQPSASELVLTHGDCTLLFYA